MKNTSKILIAPGAGVAIGGCWVFYLPRTKVQRPGTKLRKAVKSLLIILIGRSNQEMKNCRKNFVR